MKRKLICAAGVTALVLAMMLPEAAELGGAGVAAGSLLALALLALATWLLRKSGVLDGQEKSAQASDTGSGAAAERRAHK